MIDRTVVPYLAGFVLCVGSVLALAACTSGELGAAQGAGTAVVAVGAPAA